MVTRTGLLDPAQGPRRELIGKRYGKRSTDAWAGKRSADARAGKRRPDAGAGPPIDRGRARSHHRAAMLLLAWAALVVLLVAFASPVALAADPTGSAVPILSGGDLRSDGSGPGLVGSPLGVLLAVVVLGVATALLTVVVARFASRR